MMSGIWIVFRKELLDTIRDRKTLIFMLLLPTLAVPLLMFGVTRFVRSMAEKRALQTIKIAAEPAARDAYYQLAHAWFVSSDLASAFRAVATPEFSALLAARTGLTAPKVPAEIFDDVHAFVSWSRGLAAQTADAAAESSEKENSEEMKALKNVPPDMLDALRDFQAVVIKGLGLVEFVNPSELKSAEQFDLASIPEEFRDMPRIREIAGAVADRSIAGWLSVPPGTEDLSKQDLSQLEIGFLHDSTVPLSGEAFDRLYGVVEAANRSIVKARLSGRDLSGTFIRPLVLREDQDLASGSKRTMAAIGGVVPYLVILFAFMGGMYPAIDLGAGEKERNTLETLLLSPCSRAELAMGKFCLILFTSLVAAFLAVVSMGVTASWIIPEEIMQKLEFRLEPMTVVLVAMLAVPAAASFAGLLLAISIYARSFKEAQSYMTPVYLGMILPAMAPMVPGLEMSWKIAMIPLVNAVMLMREFIKGDTHWGYFGVAMVSSFALAGLCLGFAVRQFRRENVLFRTS